MDPTFVPYRRAAAYLKNKLETFGLPTPSVGIICGSGLSGLSSALEGEILTIHYRDIPGFPSHCTIAGHEGEVVFGMLDGVPTMCFRGRFHSYEGHDMKTVALPVHVMRCLQVRLVIVTNAAGGLNPDYNVGDVVVVSNHVAIPQIAGKNPLTGPNDDELGPRFPPMSNAYPDELRNVVHEAAHELGFKFVRTEGACYCFASGPMYESRAECRFLRNLGGDMVGMSTVPEITAAHHCGMKIICLSLITNKVIIAGDEGPAASHAEVLDAVDRRAIEMQSLVKRIVSILNKGIVLALPELPPVSLEIRTSKIQSILHRHILGIPLHCYLTSAVALAVLSTISSKIVLVTKK